MTPESASRPVASTLGWPTPPIPLDALDRAIATASGDSVIQLSPGKYPEIVDEAARGGWVTVSGAGDASRPLIEGAALFGAYRIRFVDVAFSDEVDINHRQVKQGLRGARNIQIIDSVIDCGSVRSTPATIGILVRGGSSSVKISGDWLHNCDGLFGSVPQDPISSNISITHSLLDDSPGDGILLGGMRNVLIDHDVIKNIADPADEVHNDGIAFFGNTSNVRITNNVLENSRAQLILIQPFYAGSTTGTASNSNILIENNLVYGAGAVALQDQSGLDVRIIGNTFWDNSLGSVWDVHSTLPGTVDNPYTVIEDNIIDGFLEYYTTPTVEDHNVIVNPNHQYAFGSGDLIGVEPRFVDPAKGDFQLRVGSPGRHGGVGISATEGFSCPADIFGLAFPGSRSIGVFQPDDPKILWGAPRFLHGSTERD